MSKTACNFVLQSQKNVATKWLFCPPPNPPIEKVRFWEIADVR
jgi:hypothetical protein